MLAGEESPPVFGAGEASGIVAFLQGWSGETLGGMRGACATPASAPPAKLSPRPGVYPLAAAAPRPSQGRGAPGVLPPRCPPLQPVTLSGAVSLSRAMQPRSPARAMGPEEAAVGSSRLPGRRFELLTTK